MSSPICIDIQAFETQEKAKKQNSGPKRGSKNRNTAIGNAKNAYKIGRNRGITKIVIPWTHQGIIKNTLGILKRDERTTFFINQFFFLEPNIRLKVMQSEMETLDFRVVWTLFPYSEHNSPRPDFQSPPDYDPKTTSGRKGYFGPVEWKIAC